MGFLGSDQYVSISFSRVSSFSGFYKAIFRDFGLLFNRGPLFPRVASIERPYDTQDDLSQHRWRVPGFVMGMILFCGSFYLGRV